jgi:preprotein translocase subunit SecG
MDPEQFRAQAKKGLIIGAFFALALVFFVLGWRAALVAYALLLAVVSGLAILIQSGRGGGLAASLGGLGGDSLLGVHSATPIAKATYVMLALFIFILILAARMHAPEEQGGGLLEAERPAPPPVQAEPVPGQEPAGAIPPVQEAPVPQETERDD